MMVNCNPNRNRGLSAREACCAARLPPAGWLTCGCADTVPGRADWSGRDLQARRPTLVLAPRQCPPGALDNPRTGQVTGTDTAPGFGQSHITAGRVAFAGRAGEPGDDGAGAAVCSVWCVVVAAFHCLLPPCMMGGRKRRVGAYQRLLSQSARIGVPAASKRNK
jgi:hypothetical protein